MLCQLEQFYQTTKGSGWKMCKSSSIHECKTIKNNSGSTREFVPMAFLGLQHVGDFGFFPNCPGIKTSLLCYSLIALLCSRIK